MYKRNNLYKDLFEFYESVKNSRRIDNSFAVDGDIPLTEEEKREIDKFWGKYKFAYRKLITSPSRLSKIDMESLMSEVKSKFVCKIISR